MAKKKLTKATIKPVSVSEQLITKEHPDDLDPKSLAARTMFEAYSAIQASTGLVEEEKRAYALLISAAEAINKATPGHSMAATLKQTAEYRASRLRTDADDAVKEAKAYQKEVDEAFGTAENAAPQTAEWAKEQALEPFFGKFLEGQEAMASAQGKNKPTMKYPSDFDEMVTMKYPSDSDEWYEFKTATDQLNTSAAASIKPPPYVTMKYPSDNDEMIWDDYWKAAPARTTSWPSDDDEIDVGPVDESLYVPQLLSEAQAPARTHRWPSEEDEYTATPEDIEDMQATLDDMWKQE